MQQAETLKKNIIEKNLQLIKNKFSSFGINENITQMFFTLFNKEKNSKAEFIQFVKIQIKSKLKSDNPDNVIDEIQT